MTRRSEIPLGEGQRLRTWPLATLLLIRVAGIAGFVGLLVAGHYNAGYANLYRLFALIWFFCFGALTIMVTKRQRDRRPRQDPGRQV